jgi:hypothetical protein
VQTTANRRPAKNVPILIPATAPELSPESLAGLTLTVAEQFEEVEFEQGVESGNICEVLLDAFEKEVGDEDVGGPERMDVIAMALVELCTELLLCVLFDGIPIL